MDMRAEIEAAAARYPDRRSAIMPALLIAQRAHGHLPGEVLEEVAEILGVERIWVYELATFYTLFHTEPVGMFHLEVCDNVSCMLCGAETLLRHMEARLGIARGGTTPDGLFTLSTVECLGACEMAPVMQVGDDYHGNLNLARVDRLLDALRAKAGQPAGAELAAATGSIGRCTSRSCSATSACRTATRSPSTRAPAATGRSRRRCATTSPSRSSSWSRSPTSAAAAAPASRPASSGASCPSSPRSRSTSA